MQYSRSIITSLVLLVSRVTISYADVTLNSVVPPTQILPNINNGGAGDIIGAIIAWLIGLTAVLTVLAISWAGVQMILATGEEEKFKKARHTMIYAFVGLIVAGLAYGVVTFITNLRLDNFLF